MRARDRPLARDAPQGERWEDGFLSGLLNSLCVLPLLSYGSTAPLAALPDDPDARAAALARGWDERPVGRQRLTGSDEDAGDNVLKEWLVAQVAARMLGLVRPLSRRFVSDTCL
jgi:hypothetical protein